jgi:hypothetical protein
MPQESALQSTLVQSYRRVFGEPDREIDVYLGFALFIGAAVLASFALAALVYADQFGRPGVYYWREQAITAAMVALPAIALGVVVLLPVDRRGRYSGLAGALVCLYGVYRFRAVYPWQWDTGTVQHSISVTVAYGVGVAVLVGAVGAALVAYQIDRLRQPGPADIEPASDERNGESYSEARIERDIEAAMADVDLSWGGIEPTETTPLDLRTDDVGDDIDTSGLQVDATRVTRESVDDQVAGLKALRGDQDRAERSASTVDDQSAKLAEIREQRRTESTDDEGLLAKLFRRLGLVD